jgi:cell division protein FtsL
VPTAVWCVALVFVILFGAASLQVRLIGGQERLDRINAAIDKEQVKQDDLRQQEANLRSPAQIAEIATNELGMVQAAPPMLVNPVLRYIGSPHPQTAPTTTVPVAGGPASEAASAASSNGNG